MNAQQTDFFTAAGNTPKRTVRITFDGGAKGLDIPGLGNGYGSYQIDRGPIIRVDHRAVMTANAAEVLTLCEALKSVTKSGDPATTKLIVCGDSQVTLSSVARLFKPKTKVRLNGHESFQDACEVLSDLARRFAAVETTWQPREKSVALFGH
jgi:ribonuclease HI